MSALWVWLQVKGEGGWDEAIGLEVGVHVFVSWLDLISVVKKPLVGAVGSLGLQFQRVKTGTQSSTSIVSRREKHNCVARSCLLAGLLAASFLLSYTVGSPAKGMALPMVV